MRRIYLDSKKDNISGSLTNLKESEHIKVTERSSRNLGGQDMFPNRKRTLLFDRRYFDIPGKY